MILTGIERKSHGSRRNACSRYTLPELCERLGISIATGRNWVRLGKLTPDIRDDKNRDCFSNDMLKKVLAEIHSPSGKRLKSRRNKKMIQNRAVYAGYLDEKTSVELEDALSTILNESIEINQVLAFASSELLQQVLGEENVKEVLQELLGEGFNEVKEKNQKLSGEGFDEVDDKPQKLMGEGFYRDENKLQQLRLKLKITEGQDILGFLYSSLRASNDRKLGGAYFTPRHLAEALINEIQQEVREPHSEYRIFDPACGSGSFLLQLLQQGFPVEQLYGCDIDPVSVQITKVNLFLYCSSVKIGEGNQYQEEDRDRLLDTLNRNIRCRDFLTSNESESFDLIIGNPPWGGETGSKAKEDICDLFIEKAISQLTPGGKLAFLVPEAVFYVKAHKKVQKLMAEHLSFSFLQFLGEQFPGVICPAVMFVAERKVKAVSIQIQKAADVKHKNVQHKETDTMNRDVIQQEAEINAVMVQQIEICRIKHTDSQEYTINHNRIYENDEFTFRLTDQDYLLLRQMEAGDRVYLRDNADFALGIVTGDNKEKLLNLSDSKLSERTEIKENQVTWEPVLTGKEIRAYTINEPKYFMRFIPEKLQQSAPEQYYRVPEKLVYRFISDAPVVAYDDKQRLTLNSCNILIPRIFGLDMKYIMAVLNSEAVRFYYKKRFGSMKVLRSHLEEIPIPIPSREEQNEVVELVNQLRDGISISKLGGNNERKIYEIHRKITERIKTLYMI